MIKLVEAPHKRAICETKMRYNVLFNGIPWAEVYFNIRGYVGALPTPEGPSLHIGEKPISAYRKEIARLNREFKNAAR